MKGRGLAAIGPAIIVASIVLGPGSIVTSSQVGADFGYDLTWVVVIAAALMLGMVALAARLGVSFDGSICDEIAARAGRPVAVLVGVVLFLVVACFQFSNNVAIVAALELFGPASRWPGWISAPSYTGVSRHPRAPCQTERVAIGVA